MSPDTTQHELWTELEQIARRSGAVTFGVASIDALRAAGLESPTPELDRFPRAISVGFHLSDAVVETLVDHPTKLYAHHYRMVNAQLDRITLELTAHLQARGHDALPIPASQIIDWEANRGAASHKWIAYYAGLGFFGLNNLIIHPTFGARLRYASVYTDAPLPVGAPLETDCGDCTDCLAACPCGAIGRTPGDFDLERCDEQLRFFRNKRNIGHYICGLCLKACRGPDRRKEAS